MAKLDETTESINPDVYPFPSRRYSELYKRSIENPDTFWAVQAHNLDWTKEWDQVLDWQIPYARWFVGGKLNASVQCVDRHAKSWRRDKTAIIWEAEGGEVKRLTYADLYREVNRYAWVLKSLGVKTGDRVFIYLPMIPELAIFMLACARIGALHVVTFAGFSSQAVADRINDSQPHVVITVDGSYRRGKILKLKEIVDEALNHSSSVEKVIVVKRTGIDIPWNEGRDMWLSSLLEKANDYTQPEVLDSGHPLFILYTSGTTGTPKGIVHDTGGYLTYVYSTYDWTFHLREDAIFWCTADIGWITGHSYVVYGPLAHGDTTFMYEGATDYPNIERWWDIVERHHINVLYTSPTAIRTFMKYGTDGPNKYNLYSLELLGSVGEPINPEAWRWFYEHIGRKRCGIVDTWWQTETGGFMVAPAPGIEELPLKPGSATFPLPGIEAMVVDGNGEEVPRGQRGYLVIKKPWPGMLTGIYNSPELYQKTYWDRFPGYYYAGDYAMQDDDGYLWFLGRADEVIKVAGHRLGTAELESVAITHPCVAESAVVSRPDPVKGEAIVMFITLNNLGQPSEEMRKDIREHIRRKEGAIATPEMIFFIDHLPKTRSGKIMRRVMRAVVSNAPIGDISTLEDEASVEEVRQAYAALRAAAEAQYRAQESTNEDKLFK